ncbi:MAG: arginase family protein [Candidatus Heimdallarchaeota archaeon]|nr:arginase family protein [Candidatus Heimdallarchaeota archaeon]
MSEPFNGTFGVDEIDTAVNLDAVILGVPFEDNSRIYPKGASLAPNKIREMSYFFSGQSFTEQNIHSLNVLDLGNLNMPKKYEASMNLLSEKVSRILHKNAMPIILGGDHSIATGTVKGIIESQKKIDAVIWLDAHVDLMDTYPDKEKYSRATSCKRIFDMDFFPVKNYYFIGCRGHNLGLEEVELIKKNEMTILEAQLFSSEYILNEINKIFEKHDSFYVSLDIDVLDPAFAPGVSVPEPGGLSSRELFSVIQILAKKTKCFEIVEINPNKDFNNLTSMVACKAIFGLLDSK